MNTKVTDSIKYIGVIDSNLEVFESQYPMEEEGMTYNSYLIKDEKIAVMDTVDPRAIDEWISNLDKELDGKSVDYLVIHHLEPDHTGGMLALCEKFPQLKIVASAKAIQMLPQFFEVDNEKIAVKEGDTLELGVHTLTFVMAPMVHWPEVMVSYESSEKVLFSADGFGKFGTSGGDDWACEARRYYFNIVGKYGAPVQTLLKKASALDISKICPLHGPVLDGDLSKYINLYNTWSSYEPEAKGVVIAYSSIHGNTIKVVQKLEEILKANGEQKVVMMDLTREDVSYVVEDSFKYDRLVLASSSYDGGVFPPMENLLAHLKSKTYQNRKVAIIENGSWAPSAARVMKSYVEAMKNITLIEPVVTIKSTLKDSDIPNLEALANALK